MPSAKIRTQSQRTQRALRKPYRPRVTTQGTLLLPLALRQWLGIAPGTLVTAEATDQGLLIPVPVERYGRTRRARFLLENAVDREDYARAAAAVRQELGLDPASLGVEPPSR
jgi:bifunctional DNA-binding transcriptional regulator/antitoxin component of YhaV-PrlF toxin-antitoxin module